MPLLNFPLKLSMLKKNFVNSQRHAGIKQDVIIPLFSELKDGLTFRYIVNGDTVPSNLSIILNDKIDGTGTLVNTRAIPVNNSKQIPLYASDFCDYKVTPFTIPTSWTKDMSLYLLAYSNTTKLNVSLKLTYKLRSGFSLSKSFSVLSFLIKTTATPETITLPLSTSSISYIDWNDPTSTIKGNNNSNKVGHTYTTPGSYTITITYKPGTPFSLVYDSKKKYYMNPPTTDSRNYITNIVECINITNMRAMFVNANLFTGTGLIDDNSIIKDMSYMFYNNMNFNGILNLDTRSVTTMSNMFYGAMNFNQDISAWKTSKVTDMSNMFSCANAFKQDISGWDTSSVTNMSGMFNSAILFNIDISKWNTSKVTNMSGMFFSTIFDQNISKWDVSKVTNMSGMFEYSTSNFDNFDGTKWITTSLKDTSYMFHEATKFNHDISSWNVSNISKLSNMLQNSGMSNISNKYYSNFDTKSKTLKQLLFG